MNRVSIYSTGSVHDYLVEEVPDPGVFYPDPNLAENFGTTFDADAVDLSDDDQVYDAPESDDASGDGDDGESVDLDGGESVGASVDLDGGDSVDLDGGDSVDLDDGDTVGRLGSTSSISVGPQGSTGSVGAPLTRWASILSVDLASAVVDSHALGRLSRRASPQSEEQRPQVLPKCTPQEQRPQVMDLFPGDPAGLRRFLTKNPKIGM